MNLNLNLWHDMMYCVGVFVTCNIGGGILRFAAGQASAYLKDRAEAQEASGGGQDFADMQRQIGGFGAEKSVDTNESGE